jgi:hypothetical protein
VRKATIARNSTISTVDARPVRADELHHLAVAGDDPDWYEAIGLDFAAEDGEVGGYLVVTLRPAERRAWVWACVTGAGRRLVAVDEPDAPLPRRDGWELRAPGLWIDVECETPFEHVSVGLEAFGVAFDDPLDAIASGRGERVPLGFDLEWERAAAPERTTPDRYAMVCSVLGEVLVGDERFELGGVAGSRRHCWGTDPWWRRPSRPAAADGAVVARVPVAIPGADAVLWSTLAGAPGATWSHVVESRSPGAR